MGRGDLLKPWMMICLIYMLRRDDTGRLRRWVISQPTDTKQRDV